MLKTVNISSNIVAVTVYHTRNMVGRATTRNNLNQSSTA